MINVQGRRQLPFAGDKETRTESLSQSSRREEENSAHRAVLRAVCTEEGPGPSHRDVGLTERTETIARGQRRGA